MLRPWTEKKWVWDNELNCLVQKVEVTVQVVGSAGSIFVEEGPLLVNNGQEIFEAVTILKGRLKDELPLGQRPSSFLFQRHPPNARIIRVNFSVSTGLKSRSSYGTEQT